jgi:predicted DCC family thiol-disulfide oxidoreductase YuxK
MSPVTKDLKGSLTKPVLLYNDECGVCRHISHWVQKSAKDTYGALTIIVRPIGDDPVALQQFCPGLSIWDAYATIHLLMPDGSRKLGGEAVAEVLRNVPATKWFAWTFNLKIFGFEPFQELLNVAYTVLSDLRPIFGCESCGTPAFWMRPFRWIVKMLESGQAPKVKSSSSFPGPAGPN